MSTELSKGEKRNSRREDELVEDGTDSRRTHVATRRHCVILLSFFIDEPSPTIVPFLFGENQYFQLNETD